MLHRPFLAAAGWFAAAVAATLTGLAAVQIIGNGITASADGGVLTPQQVGRQLASAMASPSADPAAGSPAVTPTAASIAGPSSGAGDRKALTTPGGAVIAQCNGPTVLLLSWAPAQGFGVKRADRGPADHADVTFEGAAGKVELRVRCADGQPAASWKRDG
jgi:hypothetical protein